MQATLLSHTVSIEFFIFKSEPWTRNNMS